MIRFWEFMARRCPAATVLRRSAAEAMVYDSVCGRAGRPWPSAGDGIVSAGGRLKAGPTMRRVASQESYVKPGMMGVPR